MRKDQLDKLATEIKKAADLWELHDALTEFDDICREDVEDDEPVDQLDFEYELKARGLDICELPLFGGEQPASTAEVWSWDAGHILTGVGPCRDWEIVER